LTSSDRSRAWRALLRAANGLGSRAAEAVWASSSGWAGKVPRRLPRRWTSSGRERVLVIAAHADDEAMGCAGTVIRHCQAGDLVRIAIVTDGARSGAHGIDGVSMRRIREGEARRAAAVMGAPCDWIGLHEGDWSDEEGTAALRRGLVEIAPTVIYAPSTVDYQVEHRRLARLLGALLTELAVAPEMRIYAVQVPLTPLLVNLVHDVSDLEPSIGSVFRCYATQQESISRTFRLRRYAARFYGATTQVEGFCALPAESYSFLQQRRPADFRALYLRAWRDPLAAMVGSIERLSWRRKIREVSRPSALQRAATRTPSVWRWTSGAGRDLA
jgi:LmbE family N-acetylglucosaminyl deacetylase